MSVSSSRKARLRILVGAIASFFAANSACNATVFVWNTSAGGTYGTSTNWTPAGPPGPLDTARFSLNNVYGVNFAANQTVSVLDVTGGIPQFAASGADRIYSVTSASIHGGDLLLNGTAFDLDLSVAGTLSVSNGSEIVLSSGNDAHANTLALGTTSGAGTGTVIVDGSGSFIAPTTTNLGLNGGNGVLTFQNGGHGAMVAVNIADSGANGSTGTLSVLSGGSITDSGTVKIGTGGVVGQSASMTISGAGSSFFQDAPSSFILGASANSTANVTVGAGASFTNGGGTITINPTGTMSVSGTMDLNGSLNIVGGTLNRQAGSSFILADGSHIGVSQNGRFTMASGNTLVTSLFMSISVDSGGTFGGNGSSLTLTESGSLTASGGATVTLTGGLNVGTSSSGNGTVTVRDPGTFLSGGAIQVGAGGASTLTLSLGATGVGSSASVGEGANNANGTISVQSGAHFTPQNLSVGSSGHTAAVGVVNVQDPGSQLWTTNSFGSGLITVGAASGSTGTINVTAGATLNQGSLHGSCVSVGIGSGPFTLNPTGTLNINGGKAAVGAMVDNGGNIVFSSGALGFSGDLTVGAGGLLGTSLTLSSNRVLGLDGVTTINPGSTLTLSGGEFGTGSMVVNGAFNFVSGTLGICGPNGFGVGSSQLFGQDFTLGAGKAMFVGEGTTVQANSRLTIDGGDFATGFLNNSGSVDVVSGSFTTNSGTLTNNASGRIFIERNQMALLNNALSNAGRVELGGGNAQLLGSDVFTNAGLLLGGGEVTLKLTNAATGEMRAEAGQRLLISGVNGTNAGIINAFGGTVEFTNALTSSGQINLVGGTAKFGGLLTNNGTISGRGIITAGAGLTNNGQMQLSAGLTDVFGNITSNPASKIILSGGGTATFYNNVTMNSGSEFRVSTASTAVFFGNVSGSNFFTGSGTKDFEGGSSTLGAVSTTGSTIAQAPASISASFFREDSLTVAGQVTIDSGGGTSHLNLLDVESGGVLDLKNNSLVLENGDLQAITAQIRSGLNSGTGIVSTAPGSPFRLGSMSNAGTIYSSFQGIGGLNGDEVLIRYTRIGDLNLDGTVTISDFLDLASHFNTVGGATWQMGDVNYDGSVTIADFIDLASNFGQSVSGDAIPISGADAAVLAEFAANNVPEPGMLTLALSGSVLMCRRTRKTSRREDCCGRSLGC